MEIMVVMGVLVLMVGLIVMGFGTTRAAEITRAVNQIGNVVRYGYDKARVTGEHYRLLIDLDKSTFTLQAGDDKMYLPATDRDGKLIDFDQSKAEDQEARDKRAEEAYNRSLQSQVYERGGADGELGADAYKPAPRKVPRRKPPLWGSFEDENALTGLVDPVALPEGVKITSVRTADDLQPIRTGEASIYFFPRGLTQKAHILLEDEESDTRYTIKLEPLTGRVTIVEGHEELVLPDDPDDEEDALGRRRTRRTF